MITEDIEVVKKIFSIIDAGIVEGYDYFCYDVEVGDCFIDTGLAVEREGIEVTDARTDFDDTALYKLAKQLNKNAKERGECWRSFVMSYRRGGQVKTSFNYDEK
ncbi:hypothetical protein [Pseudomonas sp. B14(2022)]|uniref:hypothetical protein n=1 Tax=Pseudomonas sp. B14(2022) TaxID=2914043 RepID=UPI001431A769|nr:hypothetical protein [Pseudomonas sp. B14(2022)]NJJ58358.1 hypothetical protein [Pseudomonas sp. B14(2022)]